MSDYRISFVETPIEIARLMVSLITNDKKNALILDTGCGRGVFMDALYEQGYQNFIGVELDEKLCVIANKKHPGRIIRGDYLQIKFNTKFDVIIGNPPYAHFNSLPLHLQKEVENITGYKETDIYYAFILKSIELLKDGGEMIYIVPYTFLYNTYGKIVRERLLENGYIDVIIDLDETHLFKDEHPETIIFRFVKKRSLSAHDPSRKIRILNIKDRNAKPWQILKYAQDALQKQTSNKLFEYGTKPHFSSAKQTWSTYLSTEYSFPYTVLGNVAHVGVGLVSGFDKAFKVDKKFYENLPSKEKCIIKRFVKAKNCLRYVVRGKALYILVEDGFEEQELKKKYPTIYSHLRKYKEEMENRYLPNEKKWYEWQALRNKKLVERYLHTPKIFVPSLDRSPKNRFSISSDPAYPAGDTLIIIPIKEDPLFLLGYLNSDFFRRYYMAHGGRRGGRVAFTQRIMASIRIPLFSAEIKSKIANITQAILRNIDKGIDTEELEKEIDSLIEKALQSGLFDGKREPVQKQLSLMSFVK